MPAVGGASRGVSFAQERLYKRAVISRETIANLELYCFISFGIIFISIFIFAVNSYKKVLFWEIRKLGLYWV